MKTLKGKTHKKAKQNISRLESIAAKRIQSVVNSGAVDTKFFTDEDVREVAFEAVLHADRELQPERLRLTHKLRYI